MNRFALSIFLGFLLYSLSSCSGIQITKRHYRSGWYVNLPSKGLPQARNAPEARSKELPVIAKPDTTHEALAFVTDVPSEQQIVPFATKKEKFIPERNNENTRAFAEKTSKTAASREPLTSQHRSSRGLYLLGLLAIVPFLIPFRRAAHWASQNKRAAQWTIALGSLALWLVSYVSGRVAAQNSMSLGLPISEFGMTAAFLAAIVYPHGRAKKEDFRFRKLLDAILLISSSVMAFMAGFTIKPGRFGKNLLSDGIQQLSDGLDTLITWISHPGLFEPRPETRMNWLIVAEVLLIILAVLLFFALVILTLIFSCNLSCSGNGVAAAIVLIGGLAISIAGAILLIRLIHQKLEAKRRRIMEGFD